MITYPIIAVKMNKMGYTICAVRGDRQYCTDAAAYPYSKTEQTLPADFFETGSRIYEANTMSNHGFYRPKYHFSASYGWLNDPNGLLYHNGTWHLYFQHNPHDTVWGPMHWGHAVSSDLLHWKELPIALYPHDGIYMFSGSMVCDGSGREDAQEASDGDAKKELFAAFYTSHREEGHLESQSVAFSHDEGVSFTEYAHNPVIETPSDPADPSGKTILSDFRDPKVFRNPDTGLWNMVVAAKYRCYFYTSKDLLHWEKTGEFAHGYASVTNVWACTDLIPFDTPKGRRWVLLASMENKEDQPEPRTMYFVGDFDGRSFTPAERPKEPLWLDFGWDNYAGVSFNGLEGRDPVMIGWAVNPRYANQIPTSDEGFRGTMTFARRMFLAETSRGLRLQLKPVGLQDAWDATKKAPASLEAPLSSPSLIHVSGTGGTVRIQNDKGEEFRIRVSGNEISIDRSRSGLKDFHPDYGTELFSLRTTERIKPLPRKEEASQDPASAEHDIDMTLILDGCLLEIYADDGLETASVCLFPEEPYTTVKAEGGFSISAVTL